jgi:hypothetical protein
MPRKRLRLTTNPGSQYLSTNNDTNASLEKFSTVFLCRIGCLRVTENIRRDKEVYKTRNVFNHCFDQHVLPRQRPVGLLPGIDAALYVTGSLEAGVLRGLYCHRRALAECAVEHNSLAGRRD